MPYLVPGNPVQLQACKAILALLLVGSKARSDGREKTQGCPGEARFAGCAVFGFLPGFSSYQPFLMVLGYPRAGPPLRWELHKMKVVNPGP